MVNGVMFDREPGGGGKDAQTMSLGIVPSRLPPIEGNGLYPLCSDAGIWAGSEQTPRRKVSTVNTQKM